MVLLRSTQILTQHKGSNNLFRNLNFVMPSFTSTVNILIYHVVYHIIYYFENTFFETRHIIRLIANQQNQNTQDI